MEERLSRTRAIKVAPPRAFAKQPDFSLEREAGADKGRIVAGVDEAGRGAIAGPVVAAAVILNPKRLPQSTKSTIKDSKLLTRRTREALYEQIAPVCDSGIGLADVPEIDRLNILQATLLAMTRAVAALTITPDFVLVDGDRLPTVPCSARAVIGGDTLSLSIAAASILAKVSRDRLMARLAVTWSGYGWERNAGYATAEHVVALQRLGASFCDRQEVGFKIGRDRPFLRRAARQPV